MKICVMTSSGFEFEERKLPDPGPGEVLIRSISCGVCEGEVFRYRHLQQSRASDKLILGHEGSGSIAKIGSDAIGWNVGDIVTTSLGGAYGEYFVVPTERLVRLPPRIEPQWAVGEAVACCAYSAKNARVRQGDRVAVLGCGFMGLLIAAFIKYIYKAGIVDVADPIPWRNQMAKRYGADVCAEDAQTLISGGYDIVVEASGAQSALDSATKLVAEHGRLVIVGYHQSGKGLRSVDMQQWNLKALEITSGHCRRPLLKRQALEEVLPFIESGPVDLKSLVTCYDFADIEQAFSDVISRKEGLMKAAVLF